MKNWVNNELRRMREGIHMTKQNKSETGMQNQFIQPHEKNNLSNMNRPSKSHKKLSSEYDVQVTESLKRINEIMKKII